jgi:hypothetical protein
MVAGWIIAVLICIGASFISNFGLNLQKLAITRKQNDAPAAEYRGLWLLGGTYRGRVFARDAALLCRRCPRSTAITPCTCVCVVVVCAARGERRVAACQADGPCGGVADFVDVRAVRVCVWASPLLQAF